MSQSDRRHIPIHDHSSFRQGGKLDVGDAINGGIPSITGGSTQTGGGSGGGSGSTDITGLVTKTLGGLETVDAHGTAGATEDLDLTAGNWHSLTLDADCSITVSGFTPAAGCTALVKVTQDGTGGHAITWDPVIVFAAGIDDQPAQAVDSVSWFVLASDEGDTVVYGFPVGGTTAATSTSGSGVGPLLLESTHSTPIVFDDILQASDGSDFLYASEA